MIFLTAEIQTLRRDYEAFAKNLPISTHQTSTGAIMKFLLLTLLMISSSVFAYHTHTVGNDPKGSRDPSSIEKPKK